jgi:hypothetical protein
MNRISFAFLLVSGLGILACQKDQEDPGKVPAGWFISGTTPDEFTLGIDPRDAQHGEQSGYIASVVDSVTGFGTLMQTCNGERFRGQRVVLTAYIQTYAPENTGTLMWVRVDDYDWHVTADFDNMEDRPILGTTYWSKYEIVFDVPDAQCTINYGVAVVGKGKAWMDNITFEINNDITYKTAYYLNQAFPEEQTFPENLPDLPENLDFEE